MKHLIRGFASLFFIVLLHSCASIGGIIIANPRDGGGPEKSGKRYPSYKALNIPNGNLPPPGSCRVWHPGKPPEQQPPPTSCAQALRDYKAGTWIITRADTDNKLLEVEREEWQQS